MVPALPRSVGMSVKRLLEVAKKSKEVMSYLPDEDELTEKRTSREYIATVMNTLDPSFFPEAITRADLLRGKP